MGECRGSGQMVISVTLVVHYSQLPEEKGRNGQSSYLAGSSGDYVILCLLMSSWEVRVLQNRQGAGDKPSSLPFSRA